MKAWGLTGLFEMPLTTPRVWSEATGIVMGRHTPACVQTGEMTLPPRKGLASLTTSARQPPLTPVPAPTVAAPSSYIASVDAANKTTCCQERARVHRVWDHVPKRPHINWQWAMSAQESPISRLSSTDFGWDVRGQEAVKKRSKQPNTQAWVHNLWSEKESPSI